MTTVSTWLEALLYAALFVPLRSGTKTTRTADERREEPRARPPQAHEHGPKEPRMHDDFRLSVLIPFGEEGERFPDLFERLRTVLDGVMGGPHELVLLDVTEEAGRCGSDVSGAVRGDPRVVVVRPARGTTEDDAVAAGLRNVTGDAAVVMAGDLRRPPEAIGGLLERYGEGYDLVCVRDEGANLPWWRWLVRRLRARLSVVETARWRRFSLVSSGVLDELRRAPDPARALRNLRGAPARRSAFAHVCVSPGQTPREAGAADASVRDA